MRGVVRTSCCAITVGVWMLLLLAPSTGGAQPHSAPTSTTASGGTPPLPEPPSDSNPPLVSAPESVAPDGNAVDSSPYGTATAEPSSSAPKDPSGLRARNGNRGKGVPDDSPATLFSSTFDYAIGGFGGVGVMYTRIAHTDGPLVCGEGAVIIDHALTFGGGGCGFPRMADATRYTGNANDALVFGYGGAIIRYHFLSRRVVNVAVGTLAGGGGLVIGERGVNEDGVKTGKSNDFKDRTSEALFVFEPQVGVFANFTRWARVGVLGSYRLVSAVQTKNINAGDLRGPNLGLVVHIGWL